MANITKWIKRASNATINIFNKISLLNEQPCKLVIINMGWQPYKTITDKVSLAVSGKAFVFANINPGTAKSSKNITVIKNGQEIDAYCLGLDDNLHLKVKYKNGQEEILSSGEISTKLQ